jgi:hypothetical protein
MWRRQADERFHIAILDTGIDFIISKSPNRRPASWIAAVGLLATRSR